MNQLHTFTSVCSQFKFTVNATFLEKCSDPQNHDIYELMNKYRMASYLSNPTGPAILRFSDTMSDYWLDGKHMTKEEGERMAHDYNFNNKLMDEILSDKVEST